MGEFSLWGEECHLSFPVWIYKTLPGMVCLVQCITLRDVEHPEESRENDPVFAMPDLLGRNCWYLL